MTTWATLLLAAAAVATPEGPPTLSITARVHADSITIRQRGDARVRIWAEPGGEGQWAFDRGGLPDPIPVGRRFNNVDLALDAQANIDERGLTLGAEADAAAQDSETFIPTPLGDIPVR